MAYATVNDVQAYLNGVDLSVLGDSSAQEAVMEEAANLATLQVERRTRRRFDTVTETRSFDGPGSVRLSIPDLLSITGWTMDGVEQDVASLTRYPLNASPTLWLLLNTGAFALGNANVQITGMWGYANSVPADVVNATAKLAAAEVLTRVAAAVSEGLKAVSQGGLSQQYGEGAFAPEIGRLERAAEALLSGFRRPFI